MFYSIFVLVSGTIGSETAKWECAKQGNMSQGAAEGLTNQFKMSYPAVRLFKGREVGKLVKELIC